MSRVLVIGCGGVASVAIQKCCQADEVFTELCIASRTKEKCDALARKLEGKWIKNGVLIMSTLQIRNGKIFPSIIWHLTAVNLSRIKLYR